MKIKKGDKLDIELPSSEGKLFNLKETHGKIMASLKGFIPLQTKGYLDIVITDVLIDETGRVVDVQYGRDIGHHYSFEKIKEFSL